MAIFSLYNFWHPLRFVLPLTMYEGTSVSSVATGCQNSWHLVCICQFMSLFAIDPCTQVCLTDPGQPCLGPTHFPSTSCTCAQHPSLAQSRIVLSDPASSVNLSPASWVLASLMFPSDIRGMLVYRPVLGLVPLYSWLGFLDLGQPSFPAHPP